MVVTIIYLILTGILVIYLVAHLWRAKKLVDKVSIAVVLVMYLLRLFLLK